MRSGDRWAITTAAVAATLACVAPSGAVFAATQGKLSPAEQAFAAAYKKLVPSLNKANNNIVAAVNHAGNKTDAQIASEFTALAKQWNSAAKPLYALHAPAPEASSFAGVEAAVRHVGVDLSGIATGAASNNGSKTETATRNLVRDNHALATSAGALKTLITR